VVGLNGVIVVMCPSGGERRPAPTPDASAAPGPRVHVSVAEPCL
jgi:hypothetical protein